MTQAPDEIKIVDTLRLGSRGVQMLMKARRRIRAADPAGGSARPGAVNFPDNCHLTIEVIDPDGRNVQHRVIALELCSRRMSFLWGRYAHVGTSCIVQLTTLTGVQAPVSATIVSCQHIEGRAHEVGVAFEVPVDPEQFVSAHAETLCSDDGVVTADGSHLSDLAPAEDDDDPRVSGDAADVAARGEIAVARDMSIAKQDGVLRGEVAQLAMAIAQAAMANAELGELREKIATLGSLVD